MRYSDKDISELYLDVLRILMNKGKEVTTLEDLQNRLKIKKSKFRKIDFQSKCEKNNSLGDLLLERAIKNNNQYIDVFFRKNGFPIFQQEQVAETTNEEEEQKTLDVEEDRAGPNSDGNVSNKPTATVPPISTNNLPNHNDVVTATPNIEENRARPNPLVVPTTSKANGFQVSPPNVPVANDSRAKPSSSNEGNTPISTNSLSNHNNVVTEPSNTDPQFSPPNEKETKYKESKSGFYISLTKDVVGVIVTGLFITAAVMIPPIAGAVVCGIVAALIAIGTGLHIKNSTLPSYREMEKNRVEHVSRESKMPCA